MAVLGQTTGTPSLTCCPCQRLEGDCETSGDGHPSLQFRDCLCHGLHLCFMALHVHSLSQPDLITSWAHLCFWHLWWQWVPQANLMPCEKKRVSFCLMPALCLIQQAAWWDRPAGFPAEVPSVFHHSGKARRVCWKGLSETLSPFSHGLTRCCHSGAADGQCNVSFLKEHPVFGKQKEIPLLSFI